jgi:hypothetical protein
MEIVAFSKRHEFIFYDLFNNLVTVDIALLEIAEAVMCIYVCECVWVCLCGCRIVHVFGCVGV